MKTNETLFLFRFDQNISGDDFDHWVKFVRAVDGLEATQKLTDYIEKESPEWIEEFADYDEEQTAKESFLECLRDGSLPIMEGRYEGQETSVVMSEVKEEDIIS